MTPESSKKPPKTYDAGDTVTTKVTLAPGHAIASDVVATFARIEPPGPYDPNRAYSFQVRADGLTPPAAGVPAGQPLVITLTGPIPHHIVGGTYKPNNVTFYVPNDQPMTDSNPDPDGDLVITVTDDPPTATSKPVIQDFDLA